MARRARRFKSSRWKCSSISISVVPLVRDAPMAAQKARRASGVKPRRRMPLRVGMRGSSQPLTRLLLHKLQELAFAQDCVGEVEAIEFNLLGRKDAQLLDIPAVERLVVGELQRAHGVGDILDGIGLAVGVVVHGIDAPLVAGAVVRGVQDAVHDGIAHIQVGRRHVDFGAQHAGAVRELALLHADEQVEIFLDRPIAIGAVFAGLGQSAAVLADLVGREVVDVRFSFFDEL